MTASGERELILAAQAGDQDAFATLVGRHLPGVMARLRRWLDGEAAQDAAQDALIAAWQGLSRVDPERGFGGWLAVVATRIAWRMRERETRLMRLDPSAEVIAPQPMDPDHGDLRDRINRAVARLNEDQRLWFALRYEQGLPVADIATLADCSEATMNVRLYRLRRTLADYLHLEPEA